MGRPPVALVCSWRNSCRRAAPHARGSRVTSRSDLSRTLDAFALEDLRDRAEADPAVVHLEDATNDRCGVGIGLERPELRAGRGLRAVRVGESGVDEAVAVVRPATEPASVG